MSMATLWGAGYTMLNTEATPSPHLPGPLAPCPLFPAVWGNWSLTRMGTLRPRQGQSMPRPHSQARTQAEEGTGVGKDMLGRLGVAAAEAG